MRLDQLCDARSGGRRVNCVSCRDTTETGRHFRASAYQYIIPKLSGADWECPHGIAWDGGERPAPPTLDEIAAQKIAATEVAARRLDRSTWPLFARWLAKGVQESDRGLGDTAQRFAAKVGGEAFKIIYKKVMRSDCGCGDRQARMNAQFPYRVAA